MSRIGKSPIAIPAGVEVKIEGNTVTVKGPKGTLTQEFLPCVNIAQEENEIKVAIDNEMHGNIHGLTRTLIHNMIEGVLNEYKRELEINGVGYRAQ